MLYLKHVPKYENELSLVMKLDLKYNVKLFVPRNPAGKIQNRQKQILSLHSSFTKTRRNLLSL